MIGRPSIALPCILPCLIWLGAATANASVLTTTHDAVPPLAPKEHLRIATWNLDNFPAGNKNKAQQHVQWHTAAAAHTIRSMSADIICLQGIADLTSLQSLNRNLGRAAFHFLATAQVGSGNDPGQPTYTQPALLARFTPESTWTIPAPKEFPQSTWLAARFITSGGPVIIYTSSLPQGISPDIQQARLAAINTLLADIRDRKLDPFRDRIAVTGSFHTDMFSTQFEDEPTLKKLRGAGFEHTFNLLDRSSTFTLPHATPTAMTADYIWISSIWARQRPLAEVISSGVGNPGQRGGDVGGVASIHYPVLVQLPLP